ncbi:MAG: hypothetical protein IPN33_02995 [Saprospiraceae bacterium]|nr:hypothetical protein [Saprospiraceae bacterium]
MTNRNGEAVLPLQANKNYLLMVTKPGYVSQEVVVKTPEEGPLPAYRSCARIQQLYQSRRRGE